MEVYVSYIVGSGISAFLGKVAYSYLYPQDDELDQENDTDEIEYNLVDSKLNERKVSSDKDKRDLGNTFKEKMDNLQLILKTECKRSYPINNTKKVRSRWLRYIKEYETIGHGEFVFNHTSKPFKSN